MNDFKKFVFIILITAITATSSFAQTHYSSNQKINNNWVNGTNKYVWMNGTNELCWRNAYWNSETANTKCDGALVKITQPSNSHILRKPQPVEKRPIIVNQKVTYQADTLFNFDEATLKPSGYLALDELAARIRSIKLESIIAIGYTDRIGSNNYNNRLSIRRAQSIKNYLVNHHNIEANRIYIEGKGKLNTITNGKCKGQYNHKKLINCLAPDRRVEIEVIGTKTQMR